MAHKIKPTTLRLGITMPWSSRWFMKRRGDCYFLEEDLMIRKVIQKKIMAAGIASIDVERAGGDGIRVNVRASKPGLVIGRGGKGIEDLRNELLKMIKEMRVKKGVSAKFTLNINIEELRRNEISAPVVGQQIAFEIEKRKPYRGVLKKTLETIMQTREVKGAKIKVSGRLNGAEISRVDWLAKGSMPLQNLRADIDYGEATAFNSYGTVGIKVWIYKGEIFTKK